MDKWKVAAAAEMLQLQFNEFVRNIFQPSFNPFFSILVLLAPANSSIENAIKINLVVQIIGKHETHSL